MRRLREYIHEQPGWPDFRWREKELLTELANVRFQQGRLLGRMAGLGFDLKNESVLRTLTSDVLKTSEIEGERLDARDVRSSIARRLGLDAGGLRPIDQNVEGVVEMTLDATQHFASPLTARRLFQWNSLLFPSGPAVKRWRGDKTGPMQVVSGHLGRERVHFEAPAAPRLAREMPVFIDWCEGKTATDPVLKAGLAHLWFVTLHPFEDGNGRTARAIADLFLARSENSPQRFYSMSAQIRAERSQYYAVLEKTQRGTMDVTAWLKWFLNCLARAIAGSEAAAQSALERAQFWEVAAQTTLNERQRRMIARLLEGFEGNLTTAKYAKLMKTSQDTAARDVEDLIRNGLLERGSKGGRSTSYSLVMPAGRSGSSVPHSSAPRQ